jgi:hypothetical protein
MPKQRRRRSARPQAHSRSLQELQQSFAGVPPGSDEFDAIWTSLSPEDQAKIPRLPRALDIAAHFSISAVPEPFYPWKQSKRDFWKGIAKLCFQPNGEPPEHYSNGQIKNVLVNYARSLGHEANYKTDGSSILRATGRKR